MLELEWEIRTLFLLSLEEEITINVVSASENITYFFCCEGMDEYTIKTSIIRDPRISSHLIYMIALPQITPVHAQVGKHRSKRL